VVAGGRLTALLPATPVEASGLETTLDPSIVREELGMDRYGETMNRLFSGLYSGEEVRAERRPDGLWAFQMKANRLGHRLWFEFSPHGLWTVIGDWRTLDTGLWVASRLRAGTHFWDAETAVARLFDDVVYAVIRGEP